MVYEYTGAEKLKVAVKSGNDVIVKVLNSGDKVDTVPEGYNDKFKEIVTKVKKVTPKIIEEEE